MRFLPHGTETQDRCSPELTFQDQGGQSVGGRCDPRSSPLPHASQLHHASLPRALTVGQHGAFAAAAACACLCIVACMLYEEEDACMPLHNRWCSAAAGLINARIRKRAPAHALTTRTHTPTQPKKPHVSRGPARSTPLAPCLVSTVDHSMREHFLFSGMGTGRSTHLAPCLGRKVKVCLSCA